MFNGAKTAADGSLRASLETTASRATLECVRSALAATNEKGELINLLLVLLADPGVRERTGDRAAAASQLLRSVPAKTPANHRTSFAAAFPRIYSSAVALAKDAGSERVTPVILLASLIAARGGFDRAQEAAIAALETGGVTLASLLGAKISGPVRQFNFAPLGYGEDLTAKARHGFWRDDPLIGMEPQLLALAKALSSGTESILLTGAPGVGKTALMHGLAYRIAHGKRPLITAELERMSIVAIPAGSLLAGTGNRGELEEKVNRLLEFFAGHPEIIPFFDEIHALLNTEEPSGRTIADALKPAMSNGTLRFVGATTDRELQKFISADPAIERRWTRIVIPEPDLSTSMTILERDRPRIVGSIGKSLGVDFGRPEIDEALRLTERYKKSERQPAKARNLLSAAVGDRIYEIQQGAPVERTLQLRDIQQTFSARSGIPLEELSAGEDGYKQALAARLRRHVRGQDQAIELVSSRLELQRWGWSPPKRPRARFAFLGGPGIGKTELATAIAREVIFDPQATVIKTMADYKGEGARNLFRGSDPGYVGFGAVDTIYDRVTIRPHSVVILDEMEKASASISDLLLAVLDGSGEDGRGRTVDFSHCIFVLTSNQIQELPAEGCDESVLRELLRSSGNPIWTAPMVDRLDGIVLFRPLSQTALLEVLDLMIERWSREAIRPLPKALAEPLVRAEIVESVVRNGESARGLERALMRWLAAHRVEGSGK